MISLPDCLCVSSDLTRGTIIRCCTISVWQIDAIIVKISSLAESLHTNVSKALVCCLVSNFCTHSCVMECTDIQLPSFGKIQKNIVYFQIIIVYFIVIFYGSVCMCTRVAWCCMFISSSSSESLLMSALLVLSVTGSNGNKVCKAFKYNSNPSSESEPKHKHGTRVRTKHSNNWLCKNTQK